MRSRQPGRLQTCSQQSMMIGSQLPTKPGQLKHEGLRMDVTEKIEGEPVTLFEAVGGMPFFEGLANRFYDSVQGDAEMLMMYPTPDDLTNARRHLALFLAQYWGGPPIYNSERGHPRLRMRHVSFRIDEAARDTWLHHMTVALDGSDNLDPAIRTNMDSYFTMAANHLLNAR